MNNPWFTFAIIGFVTGITGPAFGSETPSHKAQEQFWKQVGKDVEKSLATREEGTLKSRFAKWLSKQGNRYGADLELDDRQKLIRVVNGGESRILRLTKLTDSDNWPTANFTVVRERRGWHCNMLSCDISDNDEIMLANVARISHGYLLLGGIMKGMSNTPRGGVQAFKKGRSGWKLVASLETEMESWAGADEKQSNHDITIITRGRAWNFDKPHSGPSATWADTYGIVKGKLRFIRERRRSTAVNALNDLVGFVRKGRTKAVRSMCLTSRMARLLISYRRQLQKDDLLVMSNASCVSDDDKAMYLEGPNLWFRFAFLKGRWVVVELKKNTVRR